MINSGNNQIRRFFKLSALTGLVVGLLTVIGSTIAYISSYSDFSFLKTFLSTIGDTEGWPQVIFNSGMLVSAPIRYLILILLVYRLYQFGTGKSFAKAVLILGLIATIGTIGMSAIPFSLNEWLHKASIGFYFLGVVVMQTVIGIREWKIKSLPRSLAVSSLLVVANFVIFFALLMFYESGNMDRGPAVITEWFSFLSLMYWLVMHVLVLGKKDDLASSIEK